MTVKEISAIRDHLQRYMETYKDHLDDLVERQKNGDHANDEKIGHIRKRISELTDDIRAINEIEILPSVWTGMSR